VKKYMRVINSKDPFPDETDRVAIMKGDTRVEIFSSAN
jgi:hypothetical protein